MLMSYIWLAIAASAVLFGAATGRMEDVSAAVLLGAEAAVELCLAIAGPICLWSGLMELLSRCGLSKSLSRFLKPLLSRIFPRSFGDPVCAEHISENFTANLLGLGNAATPSGLKAIARMQLMNRDKVHASAEMCRLVVLNTASLQLIPATVAALRSAAGAASPFDILPCVWLTSIVSASCGLLAARALEGKGK